METYLAIITTVLVLTQIIRVMQNYFSLRHGKRLEVQNDRVIRLWDKFEAAADKYLEG